MGVVYRVKDTTNQRIRALKTIRQDLDGETKRLVARLLKAEADALRRLESDFVVRIYEASLDQQAERPFVVMEFLPGRDLQQLLQKQGPLPVTTTVGLLWQAACALKAIHAHGIVHRDLKPANLYLKTREDGTFELKVLDFSISRLLDQAGERKTTIVVGTRGFMAPEQAAGYDVDHRADVYSLGQVANALLLKSLEAEVTPPGQADAPARLQAFDAWHAKTTAYQREQRYQSAIEAIEALAAALGVALPNQEASKSDNHDGLTAAATVSALPKRGGRRRAWSVGLLAAIAAVGAWFFVTGGPARGGSGSATVAVGTGTAAFVQSSALTSPSQSPGAASALPNAAPSIEPAPRTSARKKPRLAQPVHEGPRAAKQPEREPDGTEDRE